MSLPVPAGIRAVFFDAVGTLLFPEPSAPAIYAALARRSGRAITDGEIRTRFIAAYGIEEDADRRAGWVASEERERDRWRRIVTATLHDVPDPGACFVELYDHFARPDSWRLADRCQELFDALQRRGLILGMGTNYDSRVWSAIDGFPALAVLRDRVVVSAAIGYRKPAAEFFREVMRVAGCEPREVLFVGDDLDNDYRGATEAGLAAVHLDPTGRSTVPRRITHLGELM